MSLWLQSLRLFDELTTLRGDRASGNPSFERIDRARTKAWDRVKRREAEWVRSANVS